MTLYNEQLLVPVFFLLLAFPNSSFYFLAFVTTYFTYLPQLLIFLSLSLLSSSHFPLPLLPSSCPQVY